MVWQVKQTVRNIFLAQNSPVLLTINCTATLQLTKLLGMIKLVPAILLYL